MASGGEIPPAQPGPPGPIGPSPPLMGGPVTAEITVLQQANFYALQVQPNPVVIETVRRF